MQRKGSLKYRIKTIDHAKKKMESSETNDQIRKPRYKPAVKER